MAYYDVFESKAFVPDATSSLLETRQLSSSSSNTAECASICLSLSQCRAAVFNTQTHTCIMYSETLETSGHLVTASSDDIVTVSMTNAPARLSFINPNNTVYSVWNVSAGGNSLPSSAGFSTGQYWDYDSPQYVFDGNLNTQMCSYGMCNMSVGSNSCGQNTGLYITAQRGAFVLGSFRFGTATWNPSRDPFIVTIEGSNNNGSTITLGLSWTLIYNGTAGLSTDPGRSTLGTTQMINNNVLAFASYRFLVVAKRGFESCAAISEIQLFGH